MPYYHPPLDSFRYPHHEPDCKCVSCKAFAEQQAAITRAKLAEYARIKPKYVAMKCSWFFLAGYVFFDVGYCLTKIIYQFFFS